MINYIAGFFFTGITGLAVVLMAIGVWHNAKAKDFEQALTYVGCILYLLSLWWIIDRLMQQAAASAEAIAFLAAAVG